jgi:tetratricopeptide (TPR) repeat protein/tRNA A-37 threonylcarbamoyl transferase component Bud32
MDDARVSDDLSGAVAGDRYTIEREIGRGGMATVWLAHDSRHSRKVAIKTLHPDLASAIGVDRFLRELRVTAQLQHPNIVPMLDSGVLSRPDGISVPWYIMPLLQGESLRERLDREHQLPVDEALRITRAVGSALEAAHRQRVVHRDIKPENVFLAADEVYVVDFGIAKALGDTDAQRLTSTGLAVGTPAYMSPEQSLGQSVDARGDQYSLAAILYEMLLGVPPFTGANAQTIFARRLAEPARPLSTVRSTVPAAMEHATLKALERTPADRFASVAEFLAALSDPATRTAAHVRQARRLKPRFVVAGLVVLAATGFLGWSVLSPRRAGAARIADPEVVALYRRGVRAYDRRTPAGVAEAVAALRAAIGRDSTYAPAWNALAKAYARAYGRAFRLPDIPAERVLTLGIDAVDRALELDSLSADAWLTQGMLRQQIDPVDYGPTLRAVRRSIQLDSTQARPWHVLALFLADSGDFDGAFAAWRRSIHLDPAYAEGLAFFALAHYWRRNFDSAAVWADSAIRIDPNYLLARQAAGSVAIERGDSLKAEAEFDAALHVSTDVETVNSIAGMALAKARSGQLTEAKALVQRAESLSTTYEPLPLHTAIYLAHVYSALGDASRSLRALNRFQPLRNKHFQLHLRCDPPFEPLLGDQRYRAMLSTAPRERGKGC